jgi:hypothetical protein
MSWVIDSCQKDGLGLMDIKSYMLYMSAHSTLGLGIEIIPPRCWRGTGVPITAHDLPRLVHPEVLRASPASILLSNVSHSHTTNFHCPLKLVSSECRQLEAARQQHCKLPLEGKPIPLPLPPMPQLPATSASMQTQRSYFKASQGSRERK